jgi:diguanylate cyclase (GGDEF)-like protein
MVQQYAALLGTDVPAPDLARFNTAWADYQDGHNSWVARDRDGSDSVEATYGSRLDEAYQATDQAIDHLVDLQGQAGLARAAVVNRIRRDDMIGGLIVCGLTPLMALWLMLRLRRDIIAPLQRITRTLTELAAGHHDIQIPGRHRTDEIGAMAAACEAFRVNVLALDRAHAETREAKEQANRLARHDALTGLPNRRVFSANLEESLGRARTGAGTYSVLLLDLDGFKKINDLQGHHVGDSVLCESARRLEAAIRKQDTVARLGGDEFAIIVEGEAELPRHLEAAKRLATRLLTAIRQPILIGDAKVNVGVSIGIAIARTEPMDAETLLRAADIAMYRSKQAGRNTFRFFEQSMDDEMRAREAMERDLTLAITEEKIQPYFQPLIDIAGHRIRGFEALARWDHPEHGFIAPDVFVPIAEHLGLMTELTESILRQACRQARLWPDDINVSVNLSPTEFKDKRLPERLLAILHDEGLTPSRLEVEITETALVADLPAARVILSALQAMDITICLDDFGTGYSSLFHLHELKIDKVKIDRSFVQSMLRDDGSEKIIDAILSLTNSLGLPTVAEGIEDAAMGPLLAKKGCTFAQGFHFGKAMTGAGALALLKSGLAPERVEVRAA